MKDLQKEVKKYIEKNYGKRCRKYATGCPCCGAWDAYNYIFCTLTETEWEKHLGKWMKNRRVKT